MNTDRPICYVEETGDSSSSCMTKNLLDPFQYQDLNPSTDSLRLIEFDTTRNDHICPTIKLLEVPFGERPKYEALSYMWGDQSTQETINVNGGEFQVGQNLWDALCYLRKRGGGGVYKYWIDAICINQGNIPERNRQIRIMPHIYARAQQVLVWLGKKYKIHDANYLASWRTNPLDQNLTSLRDEDLHRKRVWMQFDVIQGLCSDEYWDRVWIIQEIGKAREIQICFGDNWAMQITWEIFVHKIKALQRKGLNCNGADRPLKLATQREEKDLYGYTLKKLLESHRNAVCKDPRDKVYGLVGLADDARHFPMDYQKPLVEVWKDTMLFVYRQGDLSEDSIVPFGKRLKQLLGNSLETAEQIAQKYESRTVKNVYNTPSMSGPYRHGSDKHTAIFDLPMFVAGMIMSVGPSPEQLVSALDAEADWRATIRQNLSRDRGVEALRDHEALMEELLKQEMSNSYVLSYPRLPFRWLAEGQLRNAIDKFMNGKPRYETVLQNRYYKSQMGSAHVSDSIGPLQSSSQTYLYQVERIIYAKSPWKIGIATGDIQVGDFICWMSQVKKALILRMEDGWLQIVGITAAPKDLIRNGTSSFFPSPTFELEDEKGLEGKFKLGVDAETLYILLS